MKSCSRYQLLAILTEKELQQALSIKVITKLWPKSLQKRFQHAARIHIQKLYPLQDKVLKILERAEGEFYLSVGTALSR